MLRSLLMFILCGTLAACADNKTYSFDAKTNTGDDAVLFCVKDPAKRNAAGNWFDGNLQRVEELDYTLLADGHSYMVPSRFPEAYTYSIYSPRDAEPCKSLIARDAGNLAGESAAAIAAGVLLGIVICVPTFGALCI